VFAKDNKLRAVYGGDASSFCSHASTGGQLEHPSDVNNSMSTEPALCLRFGSVSPLNSDAEASTIKMPNGFRKDTYSRHNVLGIEVSINGFFYLSSS